MHAILFALKRFLLFLTNCVMVPLRTLYGLWFDRSRGRYLIFGLPSVLIGILAVTAAMYAGTGSKSSFIRRYEEAKDRAVDNRNWREAITYARKLLELQPNDDTVRLELARVLRADDNEDSKRINHALAEAIFASLAPRDSAGHPDAHVRQAQIALRAPGQMAWRDRVKLASQHIEWALSVNSDHKDAKTLKADIHVINREYKEAELIYTELFRDHVGFVFKIVEMKRAQGEAPEAEHVVAEAIRRYKALIVEAPEDVDYIKRLANCYAMLEQFVEGEAFLLEKISSIEDPLKKKILRTYLSNLHLAKSDILATQVASDENARREYLDNLIEAYRIDPNNDEPRVHLTVFALEGFPESAEAAAVYDGRQNPEQAPDGVLQILGTHEIVNGDVALGISMLEIGLEKNPRNHQILNNLAFALINTDLNRALDLANRAVIIKPDQPNYRDTRGNIYKRLGVYDKAINDFEKAMQSPAMRNNISVYESLVECYQARGMLTEAASYQQKVDELRQQQNESRSNSVGN